MPRKAQIFAKAETKKINKDMFKLSELEVKFIQCLKQYPEIREASSDQKKVIFENIGRELKIPADNCYHQWQKIMWNIKHVVALNITGSKYVVDKRCAFLFDIYKEKLSQTILGRLDLDNSESPEVLLERSQDSQLATSNRIGVYGSGPSRSSAHQTEHTEIAASSNSVESTTLVTVDLLQGVLKERTVKNKADSICEETTEEEDINCVLLSRNAKDDEANTEEQNEQETKKTNKIEKEIIHPHEMSTQEFFLDVGKYIKHQFPSQKQVQLLKNIITVVMDADTEAGSGRLQDKGRQIFE